MGADVQVAIVGGGLAGLFTASELIAAGIHDIVVVEMSAEPGGVVSTIERDGYTFEPAAGTLLLPHPQLSGILARSRAEVVPAHPTAGVRYVYTRGRMLSITASPKAVLSPLLPLTAKIRAASEPLARATAAGGDESLGSFLRRRFGARTGQLLAWVAASGVFAGDPEQLSARAAFPALTALEEESGSIIVGGLRRLRARGRGARRVSSHIPVGGMKAMARSLSASLNERFVPGFEVDSVTSAGPTWKLTGSGTITAAQVVLAVSPGRASRLLGGDLAATLSRSAVAPLVTVGLGGESDLVPLPPGFGVLTGPDVPGSIRGVLFESSYAPGSAPEGHHLAKVIAGGATRRDVVDWDDDRIIETVIAELSRILGADIEPSFIELVRHRPGIPQYVLGHLDWLAELDRLLEERPGLHLTGWGYRGVGVSHLAADASATADRVDRLSGQVS